MVCNWGVVKMGSPLCSDPIQIVDTWLTEQQMANTAETIDIEKTSDSQDVDACVEEHVFGEVASATATLKLARQGQVLPNSIRGVRETPERVPMNSPHETSSNEVLT